MRQCFRSAACATAAATLLMLLAGAAPTHAQFDRGTISGTVKDQQGAVVPGATVTATSAQTGQTRTTVTEGTGFYTFPNLQPGRYDVAIELAGFKKGSRTGVPLDAGGSVTMDFALEAGAVSEEVTVVAEVSPMQRDVAVRKTIEAKDLELLSFSGRNPIGVPALKAGVVGGNFNNAGFATFTNGGFSINGSRPDENTITVDGAVAL
ncbi:MAG TPA: carboxypeptidase-like regulatory domain-containing protein, partial [Vicinamibacterales bacterium]|nr:carboxypeptidase-like regulatory domain-containing protein [Vicinamibacterales bacterium]